MTVCAAWLTHPALRVGWGTRQIAVSQTAQPPGEGSQRVSTDFRGRDEEYICQILERCPVGCALRGVGANDPWSLAAAAGTLLLASAVAAIVPAWKAARVDPIEALRTE
jgi:ABC-type antimicrobial peptide transport system permease subunit